MLREFTLRLPATVLRHRLAFYSSFDIVQSSVSLIESALDLHVTRRFAFYDALTVRAAIVSGCEQLLSEDMQTGRVVSGMEIVNPFAVGVAEPSVASKNSPQVRRGRTRRARSESIQSG